MCSLFGFSIQEFFICFFYCQKMALYVNFSITRCGNWWFSQDSTPPMGMRFCGHVPNSPRNKNPKRLIPYLLEKVVFLDPKRLLSPLDRVKKNFFFNFVRFGRDIDIEVSYKILWLKIPKLVLILHYLACFQKGLFGGNFEQKHPWSFRG
jgi:hypothetical protein